MSDRTASRPQPPVAFLRFVLRFDRGEYWLAHEELEELWLEDRQDAYKGLIHIAAALLHSERGNWNGTLAKLQSGLRFLSARSGELHGLDLDRVRQRVNERIDLARAALDRQLTQPRPGSLGFSLGELMRRPPDPDLVETEKLPYRVRRYDEGYRTGRDPKRRD